MYSICIVPACGLDSVPADLGVFSALFHPTLGPAADVTAVEAYTHIRNMRPSHGTVMSYVNVLDMQADIVRAHLQPRIHAADADA